MYKFVILSISLFKKNEFKEVLSIINDKSIKKLNNIKENNVNLIDKLNISLEANDVT